MFVNVNVYELSLITIITVTKGSFLTDMTSVRSFTHKP